jgi:hypothetical protein
MGGLRGRSGEGGAGTCGAARAIARTIARASPLRQPIPFAGDFLRAGDFPGPGGSGAPPLGRDHASLTLGAIRRHHARPAKA